MKVNFYLNGQKVQPPVNFKELSIELNYDKDITQAQLSTNKWRFARENVDSIIKHQTDGLVGGVGVFEGIPFRIELEHFGAKRILFNGYLDLTDDVNYSCYDVTVSAKEKKGIDWLNDNADGFTFEYLDSIGLIDHNKYVMMPYCISTLPQGRDIMITVVTLFVMTDAVLKEVDYYTSKPVNLANPFTASVAIEIAVHIAYTIALLISVVKLIVDLVKYTIQPVKYHAGMYVKDMMEIGASKMGYTFKSSILQKAPYDKLVLIPEKYQQFDDGGVLGFQSPKPDEQRGYYNGTFGDLLRTFKTIFNAKIVIEGNTMYFERRDYNVSTNKYIVPSLRNDFYGLNTEEFNGTYYIKFATDINEKNSIQDYTGNQYQVTTVPITTVNKDLLLLKHLENIQIPFALARRKEVLTIPEILVKAAALLIDPLVGTFVAIVNGLISVINAVIKLWNALVKALNVIFPKLNKLDTPTLKKINYTPIGEKIEDRKGMMLLETDFLDVAKLFLVNENKGLPRKSDIQNANRALISARGLWDNFHYINSFVEINKKHNQYYKYDLKNVPFCFEDYEKVKIDNIITDKSSNFALIDSLKWNVYDGKADIKYRVNKKYTTNLKIVSNESNGQ